MKRKVLLIAAAAVLLVAASAAAPPGFSALASAYRAAHDSGDVREVAKLICWDGVQPATRAALLHMLSEDLAGTIADIRFSPLDTGRHLEYQLHGTTYRPNLEPVGWLVIRFTWLGVGDRPRVSRSQYLIGRQGKRLLIASAEPVTAAKH